MPLNKLPGCMVTVAFNINQYCLMLPSNLWLWAAARVHFGSELLERQQDKRCRKGETLERKQAWFRAGVNCQCGLHIAQAGPSMQFGNLMWLCQHRNSFIFLAAATGWGRSLQACLFPATNSATSWGIPRHSRLHFRHLVLWPYFYFGHYPRLWSLCTRT